MQRVRCCGWVESLRPLATWTSGTALPTLSACHFSESGTRSLTTDATASETRIDARSLVGGHSTQSSVPAPPVTSRAVVGYSARPPPGVFMTLPGSQIRAPRRVSQAVTMLQVKMHELIMSNKSRDAVSLFESFVNDAFKEAAQQNLPRGLLPVAKRPAEYQWLQYIQALCRSERVATRQVASAVALMRQVGIPPRNVHYLPYLENLRRQGHAHRACEVIDEMIKSGVRPDTRCYEQAIFTCLLARDLDATSMLLDKLFRSTTWQRYQVHSGLMLYSKVIAFCAALKRIENALIFMRQMTDLQLDVPIHLLLDVAVNAAEVDDTAAVDTILHDLHDIRLFLQMKDGTECHLPLRIEEGILLSVLNCAARTGQVYLADQAWSMLKECLTIPHRHEIEKALETTWTKEEPDAAKENPSSVEGPQEEEEEEEDIEEENHDAGHVFVKKDSTSAVDKWKEVLEPLLRNDIPMVESYHAFIEAQAKAGQVEKAFEALLELEAHHPNNPADLSPAQGLSFFVDELAKDAETVDQAYLVLDRWHKEEKKVTVPMLDVIVAACSRMGDANRAFETFEAYSKLGLTHRTESYNALMEVCASQRQVEVIMKLLQEMAKSGIMPNVDTYMQIVEGYISNGDTSGIAHALTVTRREGFVPTLKVLERAYDCADKHNDEQARQLVRRDMLAAGQRFLPTFRGRGRGRRGSFRRGGPGRGFPGRGSPYARQDDPQYQLGPSQGGADAQGRSPVQTYVGARRSQPPSPEPREQEASRSSC